MIKGLLFEILLVHLKCSKNIIYFFMLMDEGYGSEREIVVFWVE